jgi:hypothetical protein
MIKVSQKSSDGRIEITVEGETVEDVFEKLGEASEIFFVTAAAKQNGNVVESTDVRFVTRTVDDNKFHEAVVQSGPLRGYKLAFGNKKKPKGSLFPKREIPETDRIPGLGGWFKYKKSEGEKAESKPEEKASAPF